MGLTFNFEFKSLLNLFINERFTASNLLENGCTKGEVFSILRDLNREKDYGLLFLSGH